MILAPLGLALFFLIIFESGSLIVVWLPFAFAISVQLVRASRLPGKEGLPKIDHSTGNLKRWHIVAACLLAGSALSNGLSYLGNSPSGNSFFGVSGFAGTTLIFAMLDVTLWFMVCSAIFAFFYLGRLERVGETYAPFIWLGVCLIPAIMFVLWLTRTAEGFDWAMPVFASGIALYLVGLLLPRGWFKVLLLMAACFSMLVVLSPLAGPSNPAWWFVICAAGYATYRMEWKAAIRSGDFETYAMGSDKPPPSDVRLSTDETRLNSMTRQAVAFFTSRRTLGFFAVLVIGTAALAFAARGGPLLGDVVAAGVVALVAIAISILGAAVFGQLNQRGLRVEYAATVCVTLLAVASTVNLFGGLDVHGSGYAYGPHVQLWKPILGAFAVIGAGLLVASTLSGKARQVRPFFVAMVLPAASVLPSESFFGIFSDDQVVTLSEGGMEAGITLAMLGIMWYAFGPGLRSRKRAQVASLSGASRDFAQDHGVR